MKGEGCMADNTNRETPRIMVVEDDPRVSSSLARGLGEAGYEVMVATCLQDGMAALDQGASRLALVVLDLGLPDGDGIQLLRRIRADGLQIPVIMLTARDSVMDRVSGLDEGADDYLAKPFSFPELLARIRARLRSARPANEASLITIADLEIDRLTRRVRRAGRVIELTTREFDLLAFLAINAGFPVSRDMLTREVWNVFSRVTSMDKIIDVHISHLREKLESGGQSRIIHTLRGIGFMLAEDAP
jgi:two-component system copper resistance phosphate regulon response regulator CusR